MAIKRDRADKYFSDVIRAKAGWSCECCHKHYGGPSAGLHCAHIYGRANKAVRWSLDNAVSLCFYCHRTFTENPIEFREWLFDYLGEGHMDILLEKKNQQFKTTALIRDEIADHYREEFKLLQKNEDYEPKSYN